MVCSEWVKQGEDDGIGCWKQYGSKIREEKSKVYKKFESDNY